MVQIFFSEGREKSRVLQNFSSFILCVESNMNFEVGSWSERLNIVPMFVVTIRLNRSFLFTLAIETRICGKALLVMAESKFSSSLIDVLVPYRLSMGS